MEFFFARSSHVFLRGTNGDVAKYRLFAQQASDALARVAGVKRGRGRGNLGARGKQESLLPRAWSRALIPFPFPFERLPRRLVTLGLIYILQSRQRCK